MLPPSTDANRFVTYKTYTLCTAYGLLYLLVNMCFHFDIRHELNFEYIFGAFFFSWSLAFNDLTPLLDGAFVGWWHPMYNAGTVAELFYACIEISIWMVPVNMVLFTFFLAVTSKYLTLKMKVELTEKKKQQQANMDKHR